MAASSFDWGDYLELAKRLWDASEAKLAPPPALRRDEALRRSVISRAYYAAFHPANAYVKRGSSGAGRQGNQHEVTWSTLATSRDSAERLIGHKGDQLKKLRVDADYYPRPVNDTQVSQALQLSRTVREMLDRKA